MCSGEREKRNDQEHGKASFFIYLSFRIAFYFVFEKAPDSLPMWLVTTVLFVPVGKHSNSLSQIFCKTDAHKKILSYSQENTCIGDSF